MTRNVGPSSFHPVNEEPGGRTNVEASGSGSTQADVNRAINDNKDLPRLNDGKTLWGKVKSAFTPQNGATAASIGSGVGGNVAHVSALATDVSPGFGIVGNAWQIGTASSRIPDTELHSLRLNQVLHQIPEGQQYNSVKGAAQYALSQTDKRVGHLGNQVIGGTLGVAGGVTTAASLGHLAPVGMALTAAGAVASGTPTKLLHKLQKGTTVVKSGAGNYNALGVHRNVHAINLRNLLGETPAGENERDTPKYHAEQVVNALGLDPNDVRSALPQAGQDLIAAKLRSW